jgi:hypothetical protein
MASDSFSILSFLAGPALLTNATSVLLLGTINRYGRSLDRARLLARQMQEAEPGDSRFGDFLARQLDVAQERVLLMVRTLSLLYVAITGFGVATMAYLIGAAFGGIAEGVPERAATAITLIGTVLGVLCLALATLAMAHEGRLSYRILREEAEYARRGRDPK